jgi:hypothetical protein
VETISTNTLGMYIHLKDSLLDLNGTFYGRILLGKKKKHKKSSTNKYGNDIIAFFGKKNNNTYEYVLEYSQPEQIHQAAEQIFGKSYYIDHSDLV